MVDGKSKNILSQLLKIKELLILGKDNALIDDALIQLEQLINQVKDEIE